MELEFGQIQGKKKSRTELHTEGRDGRRETSEILLIDSVLWIRQSDGDKSSQPHD